jgi:diguanylate cyclase (GGDEF)-like protein
MRVSLPPDFERAGREVLEFLHRRFGFALWVITRVHGNDWIVLQTEDHGYDVTPGRVFNWSDSLCFRMVRGDGPRVAPDTKLVPAYQGAPVTAQVPIGAYIGVPLTQSDGSLFGTLCAIDPARQPERIVKDQEMIELLASMLSSILNSELKISEAVRRTERLEAEALIDPLTKLANRRAWDQFLRHEEDRCRRYGHSAAVLMIDLDDLKEINDAEGHRAGDALLVGAADALRSVIRDADVVARLGGDEFGIVAVECDRAGAERLIARTRQALDERRVRASVGVAVRDPATGLAQAWEQADRLMYAQKRAQWPLRLTVEPVSLPTAKPTTQAAPRRRRTATGKRRPAQG